MAPGPSRGTITVGTGSSRRRSGDSRPRLPEARHRTAGRRFRSVVADRIQNRVMNCYLHDRSAADGVCAVCLRAMCRECVGVDAPRLICRACAGRRAVLGFEYRSAVVIAGWPLVHVCTGVDPVTMRPRVARGIIAIGNIAVGGVAVGGLAAGLLTVGGLSLGLLFALGGAALGGGLSIGGFAVGSVAIGGAAIGFVHALGGAAFGPSIIDGRRCDPGAVAFVREWLSEALLPPQCW